MAENQKERKVDETELQKPTEDLIEEISQELFGKPSKDVKYLLVTNYIHRQLLEEELTRTGLYQWINVFKGDVKRPRDIKDYNDYDIVQVNLSSQDMHLIGDIRAKIGEDSKTLLVVNNDYTTEIWENAFQFPTTMSREIAYADMLFGTEYYQTTALSEMVGRKCFVIPHPADIRRLKSLAPKQRKDIITAIWRRYDNRTFVPSLAIRGHGLTTRLIGYDKNQDQRFHATTPLYDYVMAGTNYFQFCDQMRESKIVYDPFTYHSYSRATVDAAALGVAYIGSSRTQSSPLLYPFTTIDPYDIKKARELVVKLNTDEEFYNKVVSTARERSEFYNHENSKLRYMMALSESKKDGRKQEFGHIDKLSTEMGTGEDVFNISAREVERRG